MVKGLCGVVILYHPADEVFRNIMTYADVLEKLWIIDNTEDDLQDYKAFFAENENIEIIQDGNNAGIGSRLNFAIKKAQLAGYTWLLTMDQDSSFTRSNLNACLSVLAAVDSGQNIAVIGVRHHHEEKDPEKNITLKSSTDIITSGTFVNLCSIGAIGLMNEDLFIDEVDSDFTYRAIIAGWQAFICDGIYLRHNFGERRVVRSFLTGKTSNRGIHSPLRLYYITRNFLWVKKQYGAYFPAVFKTRQKQLFNIYKNDLLYNKQWIQSVRMIRKGFSDFKKNKSGKLTK